MCTLLYLSGPPAGEGAGFSNRYQFCSLFTAHCCVFLYITQVLGHPPCSLPLGSQLIVYSINNSTLSTCSLYASCQATIVLRTSHSMLQYAFAHELFTRCLCHARLPGRMQKKMEGQGTIFYTIE